MKLLYCLTLLLSVSLAAACQNAAPKTSPTTEKSTSTSTTPSVAAKTLKADAAWLVVNAKGETMLFGKPIVLEKLPELLVDTLLKMTPVPNDIPIKFDGEVLMGTRGKVKTVVKETIEKAKLRKVSMGDKAEDMAKNFYVWYMDKLNARDDFYLIKEKNAAETLITGDLLKMLQKADKQEGGLGMDYFLQAQDWGKDWGKNVTVMSTKTDGAKTICTIQLGNGKDGMDAQKLRVTVVGKKANWRIEKVDTAN